MEARSPQTTVATPWRPAGARPDRGRAAALRLLVSSIVAIILLQPASGHAVVASTSTLYVDKGNPLCDDRLSGTSATPFCSISAGALHLGPGVTVQVAAGTYVEAVTVPASGTSAQPETLTAAPGDSVTVTGGAHGFAVTGKSYLTINGFTVAGTTSDGISVIDSNHITIQGNHVTTAGQPARFQTAMGIRLQNSTDSVISSNVADHNSDNGIYLSVGSTRNQVVGNTVSYNAEGWERAAEGIQLYGAAGNTVASNISHDNEDSGFDVRAASNRNVVVNNVSYDNGDHGFDISGSTGTRIIANTVYENVTAGINLELSSTGATIANNISVDNGINSPRTSSNIRVESGSTAGTTMDYDLVYLSRGPAGATLLNWDSVAYATISAFQVASGQELHGLVGDPRWVGKTTGDFRLTFGSGAIDSADSGVTGQPSQDIVGHARIDEPCTQNTGAGPVPFVDRGAYEYDAPCGLHIVISPATMTRAAGAAQAYTAQAFDGSNALIGDVTAQTVFAIGPDGSCTGSSCTATSVGLHTITGRYSGQTATATLNVVGGGGGGGTSVPDLSVALVANATTFAPGGEADVVATVANKGGAGSLQTHLIIDLPSTLTLLGPPAYDRGSGCSGSQKIDCFLGDIPSGGSTKVVFAARVSGSGTQQITVTASSDREANPADNSATLRLQVTAPAQPPVVVVKPVFARPVARPSAPVAGKRFTFTLAVSRSGTGTPLRAGRMMANPTIAGHPVKHVESFTGGKARLSLVVPKTAKGKRLRIKIKVVSGGASATRTVTYKVH